jgi:hypothetical protein
MRLLLLEDDERLAGTAWQPPQGRAGCHMSRCTTFSCWDVISLP